MKYSITPRRFLIAFAIGILTYILMSYHWDNETRTSSVSRFVGGRHALQNRPNHTETGTARNEQTEISGTSERMTSQCTQQQQETDTVEDDFIKRRKRYMNACSSSSSGSVEDIFVHEPTGLAVCHTQKVGCTFWKRIMSYLLQETGKPVKSPYEIDRYYIHHSNKPNRFQHRFSDPRLKTMLPNLTRVAFTRDPYTRLWSAFVDKIILPDSWSDHGRGIYKHRNRGNVECPLNITFEDFLHYAIFKKRDAHWDPLHTVCNPCLMFPQYVGKMETFSRDTKYLLNKVGLGYLVSNKSHQDHVENEMRMLISYHFELQSRRNINKKCLTTTALTGRLWRAFQLNGYISLEEEFPEPRVRALLDGLSIPQARDEITRLLVDYHRDGSTSWKKERKSVLVNAFKQIPLGLREEISHRYKHDFDLYDYEPYPAEIFPERYH
ncbi:carbohydrate sulfotransferase 11-like [Haliotis rufescens]|uniref:carbohydrate sulfotransferase 11-like n=1 Tax=Haliotis rufescens TaxID=6454 RepID=UPI00201EA3FD|nr:carbohydrate sulfotransferase 11-like [Haliotis rufescens]